MKYIKSRGSGSSAAFVEATMIMMFGFVFAATATRAFVPAIPPPRMRQTALESSSSWTHEKEILRSKLPGAGEGQRLSKMEQEFRDLLEEFLFTRDEIESVSNPRVRAVVDGIAASYYDRDVYRAFEVLYEDYMPLRLAGRLIHKRMKKVMASSIEQRQLQTQAVVASTGVDSDLINATFVAYGKLTSTGEMTIPEAQMSVVPPTITVLGNGISEQQIINRLFPEPSLTKINFQELIERLHQCKLDVGASDEDFERLLIEIQNSEGPESRLDPKRQKYNDRYDDMLVKFAEWTDIMPTGKGRRIDVLRGCFVGAENPKVVEALRVIYCDNSALRMSGNWIFKLVSALIGTQQQK